ncbi:MAG: hypothetical protein V1737_05085 [Chloroflexota bacterium]
MDFFNILLIDQLIQQSGDKLSRVERMLAGLPIRKGGKREDRALNRFLSKMIEIYQNTGGKVRLPRDTDHQPYAGTFFTFMEDAARLIGYTPQSKHSLADLLRKLIPHP